MNYPIFYFNEKQIDFNYPRIMGILNVTPDSFSDGGKYFSVDAAVDKALQMIDEGADIIDVGGESTRPGSDPVSVEEELDRTIPVIKKLTSLRKDLIVSIDTTKSKIAYQALDNGASIINDISGLTFDPDMISVAKNFDSGIIIMHIKGNPRTMQQNPYYENVLSEVKEFLSIQIKKAEDSGISKIIIDPGIGFGKRVEDNFNLIRNLDSFLSLGYPILIGLSRKSFIGKTLDLDINQRDIPTVILEAISLIKSARIIRTHNVNYCRQMVKLVSNII
jgi:dihydropteroate synthase